MTTTESIVREAKEIEDIRIKLLESAKAATDAAPILPGYQVAGFTPEQVQALQAGVQGIGAYQPFMQQGAGAVSSAMGALGDSAGILRGADTRGQFSAAQQAMGQGLGALGGTMGMYDPRMGQQFMNPYQQQVIDESLRQIQRQGGIAQQNLQAQAVKAGAFGGSREGVQRAELGRALAEQQNAAILGGLQQGFGQSQQQAQQAFEAQQGRQQQGASMFGQFGQGIAGLAGQQFGIGAQMASGLGSLGAQLGNLGVQQAAMGQTAQQLGQRDVDFLFGLGSQQQRQSQAALDAQRATEMQAAMQPFQNIAFLSDIYKGAPSTQMSMTQMAQPTPSPFQQIAGLGVGLGATAKAFGSPQTSSI
jgi:hypothetical protein